MPTANPIVEDYKLLLVFRNVGLQLLEQLKAHMSRAPYAALFRDVALTDQAEIRFSYLQQPFKTGIEVFFNHSKLPRTAVLATYFVPAGKAAEEIVSYKFDISFQVQGVYSLQDFAEPYLIEFHENLKKTFSDTHTPLALK